MEPFLTLVIKIKEIHSRPTIIQTTDSKNKLERFPGAESECNINLITQPLKVVSLGIDSKRTWN